MSHANEPRAMPSELVDFGTYVDRTTHSGTPVGLCPQPPQSLANRLMTKTLR